MLSNQEGSPGPVAGKETEKPRPQDDYAPGARVSPGTSCNSSA